MRFLALTVLLLAVSARAAEHEGSARKRKSVVVPVAGPEERLPAGVENTLARCGNCHGQEPLLSQLPLLASEDGLLEALREPGRDVAATLRLMAGRARQRGNVSFTAPELEALRAFVAGAPGAPPSPAPAGPGDVPQLLPPNPGMATAPVVPRPADVPQLLPPQGGTHGDMPGTGMRPIAPQTEAAGVGEFVKANCTRCHSGQMAFPAFLTNTAQLQARLNRRDPQALEWLKRLNTKVVHGEMLREARLSKSEGPGADFHDQIAGLYLNYVGTTVADDAFGAAGSSLMIDPKKKDEYRSVLQSANIPDPETRRDLLEFDAIWDDTGNPSWSWAPHGGDSGRRGARAVGTEPSSVPRPFIFKFDGTRYRWKEPFDGGFAIDANTQGIKKFVVARFPRDARGQVIKGTATTLPNAGPGDLLGLSGDFPVGTRFFEVMYSTKLGRPLAVDIVMREKRVPAQNGEPSKWAADAFRQDSRPEKIREWIDRQPDRDTNPDFPKILAALNNPRADAVRSELGRDGEGGTPFILDGQRTGAIAGSKSVVTGVSAETLLRLYSELPMESSAGRKAWAMEAPAVFSGTHRGVAINSQTCQNCHRTSGMNFSAILQDAGVSPGRTDPFDGRVLTDSVTAYGNGPGYDGVLSAPWFSPEKLKEYGIGWNDYRMRPEWRKFFK